MFANIVLHIHISHVSLLLLTEFYISQINKMNENKKHADYVLMMLYQCAKPVRQNQTRDIFFRLVQV